MKTVIVLCVIVSVLLALPGKGLAESAVASEEATILSNCNTTGYQTWTDPTHYWIPDCDGNLMMGPITITDPGAVGSTVLSMVITTEWYGDLNMRVAHDANCDGVPETSSVILCRAGMHDPTCPTTGCCGCGDGMIGTFSFDDASSGPVLGDPNSSCYGGVVPQGCYRPVTPLAAFTGTPVGGCWYLIGQDGACANWASIYSWSLSFLIPPASTEESPASASAVRWAVQPNPALSFTNMTLELPQGGPATIRIFDGGGRCVRKLVDQVMPRGQSTVRWNGLDDQGVRVPSGVYFAVLKTTAGLNQQRIIVLR